MVDSATVLLRERGVAAVTVDAVLAHSGAPRGSVYHHFPAGRDEILMAALARAGDVISAKLDRAVSGSDPAQAVHSFVQWWKRALTESGFRAGCPAVAVVVDGRREIPGAAESVRGILDRWHRQVRDLLAADGHAADRAERLATLIVAAIEGAIILARAMGDVRPLDDVDTELALLLSAATPVRDSMTSTSQARPGRRAGTRDPVHPPPRGPRS